MRIVSNDPRVQEATRLLAEVAQERRGEMGASPTDKLVNWGLESDYHSFTLAIKVEYTGK